ncbi:MAG: hypothetical protein ACRD16_17025, partial [Thermoanaerobaculia bacterium]
MSGNFIDPAEHLPPEIVFGYERRLLDPGELRSVHGHVAVCRACREKLARQMNADAMAADIRHSLGLDRPRSFVRFIPYAMAAVLIVALGGFWLARRRSASPAVSLAARAESLEVRAALHSGRIPLPAFLGELAAPREVLM